MTGRRLRLPPHHIVIARESQSLPDLPSAFEFLKETYNDAYPSFVTLITGPPDDRAYTGPGRARASNSHHLPVARSRRHGNQMGNLQCQRFVHSPSRDPGTRVLQVRRTEVLGNQRPARPGFLTRSLTLKNWLPFFEERSDSFLVVVAVVDSAAHPLDALKDLGSEWLSLEQNVNLFLQQGDDQRLVG